MAQRRDEPMRRRALTHRPTIEVAAALAVLVATLGPVSGAARAASMPVAVRPAAGTFAGSESGLPGGPVTFVVPASRLSIRHFTATVPARAGCTAPYVGFQAPSAAMHIAVDGSFTASSTNYPGPKVRVTVTGRFTSRTKAVGSVIVHFARVTGCNRTTAFRATRSL
jgi:hypothetical protein